MTHKSTRPDSTSASKYTMKRVLPIVALVAIFLFVLISAYRTYREPQIPAPAQVQDLRTIELRGQTVRVTVADTETTRQKGLSGRAGLAPDEGMLFVFPEDGEHAFWMKDMRFSIDILWLSADGKVVYMALYVSPDTYPQSFRSDVPARYVLELPAGYAKEYTVSIGDIVKF